MEVINASVVKEIRNSVNRRNNSDLANLRKVTEAAARQSIAIRKIKKSKLYDELDDGLKQLAELRLENPDMSLKELSESLGISRSGVNHRLERIMKIAESIREENDGKA
jgi:DNA-binding protein WhiA